MDAHEGARSALGHAREIPLRGALDQPSLLLVVLAECVLDGRVASLKAATRAGRGSARNRSYRKSKVGKGQDEFNAVLLGRGWRCRAAKRERLLTCISGRASSSRTTNLATFAAIWSQDEVCKR